MSNIDGGDIFVLGLILGFVGTTGAAGFLFIKKRLTKTRFLRFWGLVLIGMFCSLIPAGPLSMILGFPAVLLSALLASIFLDKDP